MHFKVVKPTLGVLSSAIFVAVTALLPAFAAAQSFTAGNRVEARVGSSWERCTVREASKFGGYMLRCDRHPDQETVFVASDVRAMQVPDQPPSAPPVKPAVAPKVEPTSARAIVPRTGVYGCMNQDASEMLGLQFGLLDARNYSTFDGGSGKYSYARDSGLLTFTSGPFKGLVRIRETEMAFRVLDEAGHPTALMCPLTGKDPHKKHW